jgi:exonuclease SbcD
MRFIHTSDWHLGRSLFGASLLEEQRFALTGLLGMIDEGEPDALLVAGDVFDRSVPPEAAVELLDWFLYEAVVVRQVPVFLIPGNHDSAERLGFGARLLRGHNLAIFSRIEDFAAGHLLTRRRPERSPGAAAQAMVFGLPYSEPAFVAQSLRRPDLRSHDEATRALCQETLAAHHASANRGLPAILLAHAFVAGGEESVDSERPLAVGGSSAVHPAAFEGFAYVALGHLHKPQAVGSARIRYSGSLLAYSKSEAGHDKGAVLVEIFADGRCEATPMPLLPRRPLRALEGRLEEILASAASESERERDAFVIASLLDSGPVFDALGKLRAVYPHLLHVARPPAHLPELLPGAASLSGTNAKSAPGSCLSRGALAAYEEFFFEATGARLTELERRLLADAVAASLDLDRGPRALEGGR